MFACILNNACTQHYNVTACTYYCYHSRTYRTNFIGWQFLLSFSCSLLIADPLTNTHVYQIIRRSHTRAIKSSTTDFLYSIPLIVKIFCSHHNTLEQYIHIGKLYGLFIFGLSMFGAAKMIHRKVELHWAFCCCFCLYFIFMVNNRLLLAPTLNLSLFISLYLVFFILFPHFMYACVQHFLFISRMKRCGSGWMLECIPAEHNCFSFYVCTHLHQLYLFVCLMEPLYFLLSGFSVVCVCVWWVVVVVVVALPTAIVHSLCFSPNHSRSIPIRVSFFPSSLLCAFVETIFLSFAPNDSEWLWWTFMRLKL